MSTSNAMKRPWISRRRACVGTGPVRPWAQPVPPIHARDAVPEAVFQSSFWLKISSQIHISKYSVQKRKKPLTSRWVRGITRDAVQRRCTGRRTRAASRHGIPCSSSRPIRIQFFFSFKRSSYLKSAQKSAESGRGDERQPACAQLYAHLAASRARCREKYGREFKNAAMGIGIVVWAFGIGAFTMSASVAPKRM